MNIFKFKKIFYSLISKNESKEFLKLINDLYKKNILNEELILNFIKAFVIIFYLDKSHFNIYYKILSQINSNHKKYIKLFKLIKNINFRNQVYISQRFIDKIIIITNYYIVNLVDKDIDKNLNILYDILLTVNENELSSEFTINLYLYLLKYVIKDNLKNTKIQNEILEIKDILKKFNL